jgi:hypothetical protein
LIRRLLIFLAALGIASAAVAGDPPRRGWTKMKLMPSSLSLLEAMHQLSAFVDVEQYENESTIYVPIEGVAAVHLAAVPLRIRAEAADYLDILELGVGPVDTRHDLNVPHNGRPAAMYAAGEYGLYAVQFHSGLKPVWLEEIQAIGAVYYSPLSHAGTLFGATPELAQQIRMLPFVQWVEPLHSFLKTATPVRNPQLLVSVQITFACIPGSDAARERVRRTFRTVDLDMECRAWDARLSGIAPAWAIERALIEPSVASISSYGNVIYPADIPAMNGSLLALIAATLAIVGVLALRRG